MPSKDILDKLFEVERKAQALLSEASAEASRRVADAKEAAEIAFKASYEAAAKEAESALSAAKAAADAAHERSIGDYRAALEGASVDQAAFAAACEGFLTGKN